MGLWNNSARNDAEEQIPDQATALLNDGLYIEVDSSPKEERTSSLQFYCLCWSLFVIGWNDGSTGPLLPRIHDYYNVGFDRLSWVFVLACLGSVVGALLNMPLGDKYGLGKMLVVSAFIQGLGFALQSLALPFPLFAVSFAVVGVGLSVQDALANGYIAVVRRNADTRMGILHAFYGIGALAAPLSSTQFAKREHWSLHYSVSVAFALLNCLGQSIIFRFKDQNDNLKRSGEVVPTKVVEEEVNKYSRLLRMKGVHLLTLFLVIYVGVEITIGGWIVTIMVFEREGGTSAGYIASGFFAGMTVGRVALLGLNKKLGEIRAIYLYIFLSILLQLGVWMVNSLVINAITVSLIGVFLGPMYPICISHAARMVPRPLVNGAIGWITACAAGGSTLLPFVTGLVAEKFGVGSLQPFIVVMMFALGGIWFFVPKE